MFGIQTSELVVIALVAILVFGPERVPEFFHRAGKMISGLQRTADDVWTSLQTELDRAVDPIKEVGGEIDDLGKKLVNETQPTDETDDLDGEDPPASSEEQ